MVFDPENKVLKTVVSDPPDNFYVSDNFPDPFNQQTNFNISLKKEDIISIEIYNVLGQKVFQKKQAFDQGFHTITWNGKNEFGIALPSGMYLSRIISRTQTVSDKLVLLR
jgi:flagellar hook assembly protein FlgD